MNVNEDEKGEARLGSGEGGERQRRRRGGGGQHVVMDGEEGE